MTDDQLWSAVMTELRELGVFAVPKHVQDSPWKGVLLHLRFSFGDLLWTEEHVTVLGHTLNVKLANVIGKLPDREVRVIGSDITTRSKYALGMIFHHLQISSNAIGQPEKL